MSFDPSLPEDGINVSRVHPLREAALLLAGIAVLGAALVLGSAAAVDLLVPHLPPRLEARIFSASWLPAVTGGGEQEVDPRALAAQELLDRLERHWSDAPYPFRVGLWSEAEPNAVALPGGWIALTTGLLDRVGSENELAFVLGHELGHFRGRDHLRGLGRGIALALLTAALARGGAGAASQLASVAGRLAQRRFGREQERAADLFGLALVVAEYGHAGGAADFFRHLSGSEDGPAERFAGYLSTHPLHAERIETLVAEAAERGWPTRAERVPWAPDPR